MIRTKFTEAFGINIPSCRVACSGSAVAELVAAVSNAGGWVHHRPDAAHPAELAAEISRPGS